MPAEQYGLIHRVHVRSELRLVRAYARRRMQDARGHIPPRIEFDLVRLRIKEQPVIPFRKVFQAFPNFFLRTIRIQTEKGIIELSAVIVELRRKKYISGFPSAPTRSACACLW